MCLAFSYTGTWQRTLHVTLRLNYWGNREGTRMSYHLFSSMDIPMVMPFVINIFYLHLPLSGTSDMVADTKSLAGLWGCNIASSFTTGAVKKITLLSKHHYFPDKHKTWMIAENHFCFFQHTKATMTSTDSGDMLFVGRGRRPAHKS